MFLDGNSLIGQSSPSAPTTSAGSTLGTTETGFRLSQGEEDEGGGYTFKLASVQGDQNNLSGRGARRNRNKNNNNILKKESI